MQPSGIQPPSSFPLDDNDLQLMNNIIDNYPVIRGVLNKCKECGSPCDEQIATLDEQLRLAQAFKAKFFDHAT